MLDSALRLLCAEITVLGILYTSVLRPVTTKRWREGSNSRFYSSYAEYFKEPIVEKKKIEEVILKEEKDELWGTKFKAAYNSQSCLVYYDPELDKFTNYIMRKGKKELARELLEDTFTLIKHIQLRKYHSEQDPEKQKNIILNPREIFSLAVKNATPLFSIQKIRKSGSWYKVPTGITEKSAKVVAMKWLVEVSKVKGTKVPFVEALAHELLAAAQYEGKAIAKKIELHKLCESNRSYLHIWWA